MNSRRLVNPIGRHQVSSIPDSPIEPEISNLCHVARVQVKIAPTLTHALRVRGPNRITNSERLKKRTTRKVRGAFASDSRNDSGNHMHATTAVDELSPRLFSHGQIQHEL